MVSYIRGLAYKLPVMRGEDVLAVQLQLIKLGYDVHPDGLFDARTKTAVEKIQRDLDLKVDGIVGPLTWRRIFEKKQAAKKETPLLPFLPEIIKPHRFRDGCSWKLTKLGISVDEKDPETTGGDPKTIKKVWNQFGHSIEEWGEKFGVPVELIMATICTESGGDPSTVREEPGYRSDTATPDKVSPGLMQTLISTARDTLADPAIDRRWLNNPDNAIRAGVAYITSQRKITHLDPPKVACAYNAGSVYYNNGEGNRWKMRQYPINTSHHADRFVKWFNDCFRFFKQENIAPSGSFYRLLSQE